jgi:hypothetical protein
MEFLFGSVGNEGKVPLHTHVERPDFQYEAWEVNGVWHQQLHVLGRESSRRISFTDNGVRYSRLVATLIDEEANLWKHLDIEKYSDHETSGSSSLFWWYIGVCLALLAIVSVCNVTIFAEYPWFIHHDLSSAAIIVGVVLVFFIDLIRRNQKKRIAQVQSQLQLKVLLAFLQKLKSDSNRNDEYYRSMLRKLAIASDEKKAKTAQLLLDKGLF